MARMTGLHQILSHPILVEFDIGGRFFEVSCIDYPSTPPVKALSFDAAIEEARVICGVGNPKSDLTLLRDMTQPEGDTCVRDGHRLFEGYVDKIENGILSGWGRQLASTTPQQVEILLDGVQVAIVAADRHRGDLDAGGIGSHAFELDLKPFRRSRDPVIGVRFAAQAIELKNSGTNYSHLDDSVKG